MKTDTTDHGLIFLVSSLAGSALTFENLSQAGVTRLAYSFADWLIKPGLSVLRILQHWKDYVDWSGELCFNCSMLRLSDKGTYRLRSSYDGSSHELEREELIRLLDQLKPHRILLPMDFSGDNFLPEKNLPD